MNELILHHFDWSPFAEKVRLVFGLKGLAWRSVQIPMVPPRPDLLPLTGGYRKTPVLQIGADIYCDTRLIVRELERRFPQPSVFPGGHAGLSLALSHWSDTAFFEPGAGLSMGLNKEVPEAVIADRKAFFNFMDFSRLEADAPHLLGQLRANAQLLDQQLQDGRPYLLGDVPGWADITGYFPLWMARTFIPIAAPLLQPFKRLAAWEARMAAIGHGQRGELEPRAALDIARSCEPLPGRGVDPEDPLGLALGQQVRVTPDDYGKVPVVGELVTLELHEVAVRRNDPRVGAVVTHFPRIGYRVEPAA
ncbi:MAG: glutathione S-transferase [Steroidobacteraceae bacterium]|nr:glutathione S-transferase [Steroidobacteraceae bacterium]MDW8260346.1 glutathione S-transferase [Gammaproteobacteria bacterium]